MHPAQRLLSAFALSLLSASTLAATTVYTSSASFLANVAAGAYFEDFNALGLPALGPVPFSGNGYAYNVFATSDLYSNVLTGFLGTADENEALTITFTSGNVTALGANFFASDASDAFVAASVTLTLSDGTVETFSSTSLGNSYRGFVSTTPITSLVFSAPGVGKYAGLDNFTVGANPAIPVPEPTSLLLMGLGTAGLLAARRRAS